VNSSTDRFSRIANVIASRASAAARRAIGSGRTANGPNSAARSRSRPLSALTGIPD